MNYNTSNSENTILSKQIGEMNKRLNSLENDRKEHLIKIDRFTAEVDELKLKNSQLESDYENISYKQQQVNKELELLDENRARDIDNHDQFSSLETKPELNVSKLNISRREPKKDNMTDIEQKLKQF